MDGRAGLERGGQGRGALGLDTDDATIDRRRDAGDEPAAADRDDDRRELRKILDDLQPQRSMTRLEDRIVERVDEGPARTPPRMRAVARGPRGWSWQRDPPRRRSRVSPRPSAAFAVAHMKTWHGMPSVAAAKAAPCAAFPADQVTIPRAFSSAESAAMRLSIPRGLNEPVFWNSSAFRCASRPERATRKKRSAMEVTADDPPRALDVVAVDHRAILDGCHELAVRSSGGRANRATRPARPSRDRPRPSCSPDRCSTRANRRRRPPLATSP